MVVVLEPFVLFVRISFLGDLEISRDCGRLESENSRRRCFLCWVPS